jgi:hypothetical protein
MIFLQLQFTDCGIIYRKSLSYRGLESFCSKNNPAPTWQQEALYWKGGRGRMLEGVNLRYIESIYVNITMYPPSTTIIV